MDIQIIDGQFYHVPVFDHDPFGGSGRAGGVDHIGQAARRKAQGRGVGIEGRKLGPRGGGLVQIDDIKALQGVRVLDLGTILAGPFAGYLLAELGADVIKVEPPGGDPFRQTGFIYNRGMRSIPVDLRTAEGKDVFYDLVRSADVVIDNYRPGVLQRLRIDYDSLAAVNPGLIVEGDWGLGAAIFDAAAQPRWALSLTGIEPRFRPDRQEELGRRLLDAAYQLGQAVRPGRHLHRRRLPRDLLLQLRLHADAAGNASTDPGDQVISSEPHATVKRSAP